MTSPPEDRKRALGRVLAEGRRHTEELLRPLDEDAVHRQHDPIMSPVVWDLGHIGSFEELWLLSSLGHAGALDADRMALYDPFDQPRPVRGSLPLLARAEAEEYLADVRADAMRVLRATELAPDEPLLADGFVYQLVAQHEAQHQETMLQTLDLRPEAVPYQPAARRRLPPVRHVDDTERVQVAGGPATVGSAAAAAYDNEKPCHRVVVAPFAIDRFPTTARRYAAFVADGGYERPELWSQRGWAWREETGHTAPQGWQPDGQGGWRVRRFHHTSPLDPREPVEHVTYFEAEAFATWAGARLPTEVEWEKAATWDPAQARARAYPWGDGPPSPVRANLDRRGWGPAPVGAFPAGASAYGAEQMVGDVFEWTSSGFEPYPGYVTFPYPEYSEVFFDGDFRVLRGASWATRPLLARATFRNWDHPYRRQIFAGLRLAWDREA